MQQSNVIFGALLIAFIVFITVRGELPIYLTLLRGGASKTAPVGGGSSGLDSAASIFSGATGSMGGSENMTLDDAKKILDLFGESGGF